MFGSSQHNMQIPATVRNLRRSLSHLNQMHASKHVVNLIHCSKGFSGATSRLDGEGELNGSLSLKCSYS